MVCKGCCRHGKIECMHHYTVMAALPSRQSDNRLTHAQWASRIEPTTSTMRVLSASTLCQRRALALKPTVVGMAKLGVDFDVSCIIAHAY